MENRGFYLVWFAIALASNFVLLRSILRNRNLIGRKIFLSASVLSFIFFGLGLLSFVVHEALMFFVPISFVLLVVTGFVSQFYCAKCGQAIGGMRASPFCDKCRQ